MAVKIKIENLYKTFNGVSVLEDVKFKVEEGEAIAIVGASGCGKSVLMKCISGLILPDKESLIYINNIECSALNVADRPPNIRDTIGMLFQSNALFDSMTVGENITFGLLHKISKYGFLTQSQRETLIKVAKEKLEIVGLAVNNLDKYPYELSGGMQKRVAIARSISMQPEIILLDEPTTGLDPVTAYNISQLMKDIRKQMSSTIIAITHDPMCAAEIADRIILIDNKTVAWAGKLHQLSNATSPYIDAFKRVIKA